MNSWTTKPISEISEFITDYVANGSFASLAENVNYSDVESFAVLIRLTDFNNKYKGSFVYVDENAYNFLKKSKLFGGEIIISNVGAYAGTVFRAPFLNRPMTLGPNSIMFKTKYSDGFYYYYFSSPIGQAQIKSIIAGSAHPKFNKTDFRKLEVPFPSIEEQTEIASILSSLDDKIELNLQMNQTLEAMAQAIFKEWFVNFNFPGFDGELLDGLPKGWRVGKLGDYFEFVKGVSYRSSELMESQMALVTLKSMNRFGGLNYNGFKEFNGKYKESQVLSVGDVVIAQTDITQAADVIGCPAIIENPFNYEKLIASIDLVKCLPKTEYFTNLSLFYFLNQKSFKDYCLSHTNGSTVLHLRSSEVPKYEFVVPDIDTFHEFNKIISSIREKVLLNNNQNQTLINTRDSLLPKLMTGKIEIKN